jgi:AraC family transcriptional regulator
MRVEIERVVSGIREGYGEALSLADMGELAGLSPYHMARLFRRETGLPPAAYLTVIRMEEARRRLLGSKDSVADISVQVGYTSLGAFTTRFTKTVGVPPGRYRRLSDVPADAVDFAAAESDVARSYGSILGRILRPASLAGEAVYIGVFPMTADGASPSLRPARCRRVPGSAGAWRVDHVSEGCWHVQAVAKNADGEAVVVGTAGPLMVTGGLDARADLSLGAPDRARPVGPAFHALFGLC